MACVSDLGAVHQARRRVALGGCIEATPSVWKGRIYVGTRAGAMYAIGNKRR